MRSWRSAKNRPRPSGVTLPELLVVMAIVALALTVAVPMISKALMSARIRGAANQFAVTVRAVRMIAVSKQNPVDLVVNVTDNRYEYVDSAGRVQRVEMPSGVRIARFEMPPGVESAEPIRFRANGTVDGGAASTTRFEARVSSDSLEIWEIRTNPLGVSTVTQRVE